MASLAQPASRPIPGPNVGTDTILRFRESERRLHWAVALPFMVCLSTALVLVTVYNPHPARPLRWVFSWAHRLSGLCLAVAPAWTLARHRGDVGVYLNNIRAAWSWSRDDLRWLLLMGPAMFDKRIALPHQGKFNAAEKINFMVLTVTYPMYVVTGLLIWLPGVAYLSWLVHVMMAFSALPLILGHVFMATVNPDTRVGLSGMVTGHVDRHWARHHYRRWYDQHFGPLEATATEAAAPAAAVAAEGTAPPSEASTVERPAFALLPPPPDEGDDTVAA